MKINKTISYALATTLLLGGTYLGTKATLIDEKTSNNNLHLTTGALKIELIEDTWVRNAKDKNNDGHITTIDLPEEQENLEKNKTGIFTNVQPGDSFTRYINIVNDANDYDITLQVKKSLTGNNEELMKYIDVDAYQLEGIESVPKRRNTGGYITVKIENSEEAQKALNGAKNFDLNAMFTVTATTVDGKQVAILEETQSN